MNEFFILGKFAVAAVRPSTYVPISRDNVEGLASKIKKSRATQSVIVHKFAFQESCRTVRQGKRRTNNEQGKWEANRKISKKRDEKQGGELVKSNDDEPEPLPKEFRRNRQWKQNINLEKVKISRMNRL